MAFGVSEPIREYVRCENGNDAEEPGGQNAHADQGEHVEVQCAERNPSAFQKRPAAPQDHWRCQDQFDPLCSAFAKKSPDCGETDEWPHREDKERDRQDCADPEPPCEIHQFGIWTFIARHTGFQFQSHTTDRTRARIRLPHLRVHRAGENGTIMSCRNQIISAIGRRGTRVVFVMIMC